MLSGSFQNLKNGLKKLPGIGEKSATRLAMYILAIPQAEAESIGNAIVTAASSYSHCEICNLLTEKQPCEFCSNSQRDQKSLCVVENTQDAYLIEETHEFKGRYFILGNLLSPMDGIGPNEIHFSKLLKLITNTPIDEIILALSPSVEGESTINFLVDQLQDHVENITRLSMGLPFGGNVEYATAKTLTTAFKRRYSVEK